MSRAGAAKIRKTNAMRELEGAGIAYEVHTYEDHDDTSRDYGQRVAEATGQDPDSAFKTLVCVAPTGEHIVCVVPVAAEIDLKRAAEAANVKSLSLIKIEDLEDLTGYVRGGCTPVGMKRRFPTLIDETAILYEKIGISGGRRGVSLVVDRAALVEHLDALLADIAR